MVTCPTAGNFGLAYSRSVSAKNRAVSRTLRVTTPWVTMLIGKRSNSGASMNRPRDGFNPNRPQQEAGIRMEPPPSLACATGTTPAATIAADPPLEPPVDREVFHGLRVAPWRVDSVVAVSPNSGMVVFPIGCSPKSSSCATNGASCSAGCAVTAIEPIAVSSPTNCSLSFTTVGIPAKGPSLFASDRGSGIDAVSAFRLASASPARRNAAARNSAALTSRRSNRCSRSVMSLSPSASSQVVSTTSPVIDHALTDGCYPNFGPRTLGKD